MTQRSKKGKRMVSSQKATGNDREALGYNPNRTIDLFALTTDGYIIAQDVACQHEYIAEQSCPNCNTQNRMIPVASINRSFQGLSELVVVCRQCGQRSSFIFDISNDIFQSWLAERMGDLYSPAYEGTPRTADPNQRYFS